jgi:hypothetical protein
MNLRLLSATVVVAAAAALHAADSVPPGPVPLIRTHAHNDYEHQHPLFDALAHGFCSVEADIYLVDGRLLVAHDRNQVRPERTLEVLYLDPLRERVRRNHGRVYAQGPPCTLLIDVKSDAETTYADLRVVLKPYADMLTVFRGNTVEPGPITVIISGNRARALMAAEPVRYAAVDGILADLDSTASPRFIPWISDNWSRIFKWPGYGGPIPPAEKQKLQQIVARAHQQGRKVRFWGAPDFRAFWEVLWEADVDLINTDDLAGVEKFLLEKRAEPMKR